MTDSLAAFLDEVRAALGDDAAEISPEVLADYGAHTLPSPDMPPRAVLYPRSTDDVQAIVRLANRFRVTLSTISTGQNLGLGSRAPVRPGQVVLDLGRHMNRILDINDELGYCVVEPGVTFLAMHAELVRRGSKLMLSPTAGPPLGGLVGNALDRGGGTGAYGDHFGNVCGMEIILGNGELIRTGDGGLEAAEHLNWHVTKYSFGPALDGLFTQSNYGIVTKLGMWLMQRPGEILPFFFTFPDDDDLEEIVELIRPLKAAGAVPSMIRATSDLYLLASQEPNPEYAASSGAHALSDAGRRALQRKYGVGAWTVSGALYGANETALQPALERVRAHFCRSGKARAIPLEEAQSMPCLRVAINSNRGIPASGELTMLQWRPGDGAIWFTPGTPLLGKIVNDLQRDCRAICAEHGLDYMASNVCGSRFARGVHAILYNRNNPEEAARADRVYRGMSEAFARRGVFVGRAPTAYHDFHQSQRMASVIAACQAIKAALDPNGVLAPGRYGIP